MEKHDKNKNLKQIKIKQWREEAGRQEEEGQSTTEVKDKWWRKEKKERREAVMRLEAQPSLKKRGKVTGMWDEGYESRMKDDGGEMGGGKVYSEVHGYLCFPNAPNVTQITID